MRAILGKKIQHLDFVEKTVSTNQIVLRIGTTFGLIVELLNIFRVLCLTNAKLSTLNNRIYFSFYLVYFLFCAIFLIMDTRYPFTIQKRYRFYVISVSAILCWHLFFNMYDVYRSSAVGYFTIITVIFFFAGFFMFKPLYTIISMSISSLIFIAFLKIAFSSGEVINFTINVALCILMYLLRYKHLSVEISQANQIQEVQQELEDTRREFQLTIEQYELIREQESSFTFEWNVRNDWIRFSKEWKNYFDYPEEIMRFQQFIHDLDALSDSNKDLLLTAMRNIENGIPYQKYEVILPIKTGESRWFELRAITQTNERNEPTYGVGMLSDVTDRKEKIKRLETEIQMDLFTGLLNKQAIEQYGEKKIQELQKGEKLAALILDMDNFKDINDHYGHPVGDYVLKEVAAIMRHSAPTGVKIGRIGGDEFIALLASNDLVDFENYAKELVKSISQIKWKNTDISASCSVGLAAVSSTDTSYAKLYQKTDEALYQAKRMGKNQLHNNLSATSEK